MRNWPTAMRYMVRYSNKPDNGAAFGLEGQDELMSNGWDTEDGTLAGAALTWPVDG
jgi:hypothetical protein